jgi:two-component system copper resistance phosphate regulon response regulator CusR
MILVTEDERRVRSFLVRGLAQEGYAVREAADGEAALSLLAEEGFELLLLDWTLPRRSGLEVLAAMRSRGDVTPVIMVTARDAVEHRIEALDAGADDYLVKPFSFGELLARIRAVTRRSEGRAEAILRCGDLSLDPRTRKAERAGRPISLTAKEFALLRFFLEHQGEVLSRARIVEAVWDHDFDTFSNVVDVYVRHLRVKLDEGQGGALLHTVRGAGYTLRQG